MRITPLDIRKQEFRRVMRGLDPEEVYAFLSTVADEYETFLNDNKALRERLLELDDKVQEYRNMEKTLRNTLLTAERVTGEATENARREAELIIKEAEIEAEKAFRNIKNDAMKFRADLQDLKRQKETYLARLKMLVESHLKIVDNADREFAEEDKKLEEMFSPNRPSREKRVETKNHSFAPSEPVREERLEAKTPVVAPPVQTGMSPAVTEPALREPVHEPKPESNEASQAVDRAFTETGGTGETRTEKRVEATPSSMNEPFEDDSKKAPDLNEILDRMAQSQKETLQSNETIQGQINLQPTSGSAGSMMVEDPASYQPSSIPPMGEPPRDTTHAGNPALPKPAEAALATLPNEEESNVIPEAQDAEEIKPEDQIKQEFLSRSFGNDEKTQ
jgi:cell division initiation protein